MKKKLSLFFAVVIVVSMFSFMTLTTDAATQSETEFLYKIIDNEYVRITRLDYTDDFKHIVIPDTIEGYPVKVIGEEAFCIQTYMESIVIPDSVERIERCAFQGCYNLKTITLPKNLKMIEGYTFENCRSLKTVIFNENLEEIHAFAFRGSGITSAVLPDGLKLINLQAFKNCPDLNLVRIPESVTSMEDDIFVNTSPDLFIIGSQGSLAQAYAHRYGINFAIEVCNHNFVQGVCTKCGKLLGDLNGDGVLDMDDYTIMTGYVADPSTCPDFGLADINQDGLLNDSDTLYLLQIIYGLRPWPEQ